MRIVATRPTHGGSATPAALRASRIAGRFVRAGLDQGDDLRHDRPEGRAEAVDHLAGGKLRLGADAFGHGRGDGGEGIGFVHNVVEDNSDMEKLLGVGETGLEMVVG